MIYIVSECMGNWLHFCFSGGNINSFSQSKGKFVNLFQQSLNVGENWNDLYWTEFTYEELSVMSKTINCINMLMQELQYKNLESSEVAQMNGINMPVWFDENGM